MNAKHVELLRRLEQFQLDSAEAALPFSARLARENNWSADHARRVIAEYKRFAFLAVAAGHPVSPSEDVDQAWHLHLTYSQNYWKVFCPEILGQPLHHQPTKGGNDEHAKYGDWYRKTLESYREFFGEKPPGDIWPSPEKRDAEKHNFVRVDRERNWVIRKPQLRTTPKFAVVSGLLALATLCSGAMLAQGANPFDWRGPDFLTFYVVLFAACFGLASWLRRKLRTPIATEPLKVPELDERVVFAERHVERAGHRRGDPVEALRLREVREPHPSRPVAEPGRAVAHDEPSLPGASRPENGDQTGSVVQFLREFEKFVSATDKGVALGRQRVGNLAHRTPQLALAHHSISFRCVLRGRERGLATNAEFVKLNRRRDSFDAVVTVAHELRAFPELAAQCCSGFLGEERLSAAGQSHDPSGERLGQSLDL